MPRRRSSKIRSGSTRNDDTERNRIKKFLSGSFVFTSDRFDEMAEFLACLNKKEINKKDDQGRTLLHIAASIGDSSLVKAVLANKHADTSIKDDEKRTAFHRALSAGKFGAAHAILKSNFNLETPETSTEITPFETFDKGWKNVAFFEDTDHLPTELFLFGSNVNQNLGFGDSNDRARPKLIKFTNKKKISHQELLRMNCVSPSVMDVSLAKRHSAVLIGEPQSDLLVCGLGARLGLGNSDSPFKYTSVSVLGDGEVTAMAVGVDHTVVVLSNGDCYTWGDNQAGQLGYCTNGKSQKTPRKVRRIPSIMKGCAASNIHTVVYTDDELYCWGTNTGQMGFRTRSARGFHIEHSPRCTIFPGVKLDSVCCSETATVLLLKNGVIHAFMDYDSFVVTLDSQYASFDRRNSKFVEIRLANSGWLAARDSNGFIYRCHLKSHGENRGIRAKERPALKIVWNENKLANVTAMDIADDGSMIISCKTGVWKLQTKHNGSALKCERAFYLSGIKKVRCDPSFQSFAVIRQDVPLEPIKISKRSLGDNLLNLISFLEFTGETPSLRSCTSPSSVVFFNEDERNDEERFSLVRRTETVAKSEDLEEDDFKFENSESVSDSKSRKMSRTRMTCELLIKKSESELKNAAIYSSKEANCDFEIRVVLKEDTVSINIHELLVISRCHKLAEHASYNEKGCRMDYQKNENLLELEGFELAAVMCFVLWLYVGELSFFLLDISPDIYKDRIRPQTFQIARFVGFYSLESDFLRNSGVIKNTLGCDLADCRNNESMKPDVTFRLANNKSYYAHSYILRCRSAYFDALLSDRWADSPGKIQREINFDTVEYEDFDIVMLHLYGDATHRLFENIKVDGAEECLARILSVTRLAESLLLKKLVQVCEAAIMTFLNLKNAAWLLEEALMMNAFQLQDRIIFYICHNLEPMLENRFLDDIEPELIARIDKGIEELRSNDVNNALTLNDFYKAVNNLNRQDISCSAASDEEFESSCDEKFKEKDEADTTGEEGVFSLEMDSGDTSSKSNENDNGEWTVVGEKKVKRRFSASVPKPRSAIMSPILGMSSTPTRVGTPMSNRSIPSTPINIHSDSAFASKPSSGPSSANGSVSSVDVSIKSWKGSPRIGSMEKAVFPALGDEIFKEKRRHSKKIDKAVVGPWTQQPLSSLTNALEATRLNTCSPTGENMQSSSSAMNGDSSFDSSASSSTKKSGKLSQKDRRRLQHEEKLKQETTTSPENPWNVSTPLEAYGSMFDQSSKKGKAKFQAFVAENTLSFTEIAKQTQLETERRKVKNLEEIQQEQRFERWWQEESAKVQAQMKGERANENEKQT